MSGDKSLLKLMTRFYNCLRLIRNWHSLLRAERRDSLQSAKRAGRQFRMPKKGVGKLRGTEHLEPRLRH